MTEKRPPAGAGIFLSRLAKLDEAQGGGPIADVAALRADLFESVFLVIALEARAPDEPDLDDELSSLSAEAAGAVFASLCGDSEDTKAVIKYRRVWTDEHQRLEHGFYFRLPDPTKLVRDLMSSLDEVVKGLDFTVKMFQVALGPGAPSVQWVLHVCETDDLDGLGLREYYIEQAKKGDIAALRRAVAADWWFASQPPTADTASQCEALASCYHAGRGVPRDPTEEAYWLQRAASLRANPSPSPEDSQ